ncbi:MAG: type II toxin-antitoxin system HipA family toxin [Alcanivorax sp.]|nr:type II toxin-antitoxin system HipA family toxin [Alcanivorax sp.]
MTDPVKRITVTVDGEPAGRLVEQGRKDFSFTYQPEAADREVSLTMPWRDTSWQFPGLHPVFAQNLPEGYLKDVLARTVRKLHGASDLALLTSLGPFQIGRLGYQAPGTPAESAAPGETLDNLLRSGDPDLFEQLVEKYALRSGISGVQPKVLVDLRDKAAIRSGRLIVKSWGDDFPQLALNEYYCMRVADLAGLEVPRFDVSLDGRLFVMERFDVKGDGGFLGFEDACSLQGLVPEEKYDSTYERLIATVETYVSPEQVHRARRTLFTSLLVSWAVRNGDAHLKNFGLLYADTRSAVRLAPAFDIVTTTVYLSRDVPALQLGGSKRWWKVKRLEQLGRRHCKLSPATVREQMAKVVNAVDRVVPEMDEAPPYFRDIGQSMKEQWTQARNELADFLNTPH